MSYLSSFVTVLGMSCSFGLIVWMTKCEHFQHGTKFMWRKHGIFEIVLSWNIEFLN